MARPVDTECDKLAERSFTGEWGYIYCVDLTEPLDPKVAVRTEGGTDHDPGARTGFYLRAGRRVDVYVWANVAEVTASLSGELSAETRAVFDGLSTRSLTTSLPTTDPWEPPPPRFPAGEFIGRSAGYVKLEVKLGQDGGQGKFTREIRIEDVYRGALRLGVLAGFAPWDHEYSLASGPGDSKYVRVDAGGSGFGLPLAELVVGYSWFCRPIYERRNNFSYGPYVGLGVVRVDPKGVVPISSLLMGFELSFGMSFSVALTVGIRRTTRLNEGFAPGSIVSGIETDVPERFALTPQFGVVFNLAQDLWKAIDTVAK